MGQPPYSILKSTILSNNTTEGVACNCFFLFLGRYVKLLQLLKNKIPINKYFFLKIIANIFIRRKLHHLQCPAILRVFYR